MSELIGSSIPVFIGLTVALFGGAAYLMGQALGATWRPAWLVAFYAVLLGCADRFFHNVLFADDMWSLGGYVVDTGVLMAIALGAYRATLTHKMVTQYPWLYRRSGIFSWREKGAPEA
ncbi:MAG: DUF6867 family protein [Alphaproteobacteria bacterium]